LAEHGTYQLNQESWLAAEMSFFKNNERKSQKIDNTKLKN
jgi:hypothetical protein